MALVLSAAAAFEVSNHSPDAATTPSCGNQLLGDAQGFNIFVQGDDTQQNTSVQGRVAAGGNVSVTGYSVGTALSTDANRTDLVVGGNLSANGASAANGSVTYGGTLTGSISTPNGTLNHAPPPFDFAADFAALATQSAAIAALTPTDTAGGPAYAFDFTGSSTTTNVFTLPAATLQTAQVIRFRVPPGSSTVVNVTGSSYSSSPTTAAIQIWDGSSYVQPNDSASPVVESMRTALLWNFPDATSVQLTGIGWQGTILAPKAADSFQSGDIYGTIIAATLSGTGTAHNHPYVGCVPIGPPTPPAELKALDDAYTMKQGETLHIDAPGVLGNDTGTGGTLTAELASQPGHGTLTFNANGSFTYTPTPSYSGTDTFTYRAREGSATSNVATVTITIAATPKRLVTFVARVCGSYTDVMANLQRDDRQESLRDLGKDSVYADGDQIDPDVESANDPNCDPLPDWQFALGTGQSRGVPGPWGLLSIVTGPFPGPIVTLDHTALLNNLGQATGRQIEGAVTVTLSPDEAALATQPQQLWVQGGIPTDPILNDVYPGDYGFAALRCSVDNLFSDNSEWIAFPVSVSHVFCYAYYVAPPAQQGEIVVRKVVSSPAGATQTFTFTGNVTFNGDGSFELPVVDGKPASATFRRLETIAGDAPWTFAETVPPGWRLDDITCTSQTGRSVTTTDLATAATTVKLAGDDTVTCTYSDSQIPPDGTLTITKTSQGGTGTFHYSVSPTSPQVTATATTTKAGDEVAAQPDAIRLEPGTYKITETLPASPTGRWKLTSVTCNGATKRAANPVTVTITASAGTQCAFVNTFVPAGSLTLDVTAYGNTGTAGFTITPQSGESFVLTQQAKVTEQGVPTKATGDSTGALPLRRYRIQQYAAGATSPIGWTLNSVTCNGELVGSSSGAVEVTLKPSEPHVSCSFVNVYTPPPGPGPNPGPGPTPPGPDPVPETDLHITKTADKTRVTVGDVVTYTIKVRNAGKAKADGVVVAEKASVDNAKFLSLRPSQGRCTFAQSPASCYLGTIAPGETVTIVARMQATKAGALPNDVAVNSATIDPTPPTSGVEGESVVKKPRPKPRPPRPKPGQPPPFTG